MGAMVSSATSRAEHLRGWLQKDRVRMTQRIRDGIYNIQVLFNYATFTNMCWDAYMFREYIKEID